MSAPALRAVLGGAVARLGQPDKLLHIRWSFGLTLATLLMVPVAWSVGLVFALGIAKECWDHRHGSGFCYWDIAGNLIGIFAAWAIA